VNQSRKPGRNQHQTQIQRSVETASSLIWGTQSGSATKKMGSKGNSDSAKQGWGRLMVAAIGTYGSLIKDAELEDIEERLVLLEAEKEELLKNGRGMR